MPADDKVSWWERELRRSEDWRDEVAKRQDWEKLKDLWNTGAKEVSLAQDSPRQTPSTYRMQTTAFPNWVWAFSQVFIPAVYFRHPKILTVPTRPDVIGNAEFAGANINYTMETCHYRRELCRVINDALVYGHGWMKLGWFTQFGEVPPTYDLQGKNPSTISHQVDLKMNDAYSYRVNPERMYVDPDATCYEEARWVAQQSFVPIEDIKKDPYLGHKKDITPLSYPDISQQVIPPVVTTSDFQYNTPQWADYWEIWDRVKQRVYIWCRGSKDWNRVIDPWPWQGIRGFPFKFLSLTEGVNEFYPVSVIIPWMPLLEELAFIRSIRMHHTRKQVSKLLIPRDHMTPDEQASFRNPDEDVVTCTDPKATLDFKGLQPEANLYASEERVTEDLRNISGFGELLSGTVPFSRIAATTSAIMERNSTLRFERYSGAVADFIVECARDLFIIVRQFQSYPTMVLVAGGSEPEFEPIDQKQLEGEFLFKINVDDLRITSKTERIKEKVDILSMVAQVPGVKLRAFVEDILREAGYTHLDRYLEPEAGPPLDPYFENTLLAQGIPVPPNPQEDFELHLNAHAWFMEQPDYQTLVQQNPPVHKVFADHIQQTNMLVQMAGMMAGQQPAPGPNGKPTPTPSQQQGRAMPGSQPVGGPNNAGRGGGAQNMMAQPRMGMPGGPR